MNRKAPPRLGAHPDAGLGPGFGSRSGRRSGWPLGAPIGLPATAPTSARTTPWVAGTALAALLGLVGACASGPVPPQWRLDAVSALDRAAEAWLAGDARAEAPAFELARERIARTGSPALLARAELMRCATRVASLDFAPCEGYERLRGDAEPPERAYAEHLAARALRADDIARLPAAQQPAARAVAGGEASPAVVQGIDDPLSRLIAAAVLFQAGKAGPAVIALAADTASERGWRRPLLAWLNVQALRADRAGDTAEAERVRRRIALVQGGR